MDTEVIKFLKVRTGSKEIVMAGDEVNQTLTLTNQSEYDITNITIKDTLSEGVTYKDRSVSVNGTANGDYNPINSFTLPDIIKASNSATVTYKVIIGDNPPLNMTAVSQITYTCNGNTYTENSTTYTMKLANADVVVEQTSNKVAVTTGQIITYYNTIKNNGTVNGTKVFFQNAIPDGTEFVENSVKINNEVRTGYNIETGFNLSTLYTGESINVSYDVKVV